MTDILAAQAVPGTVTDAKLATVVWRSQLNNERALAWPTAPATAKLIAIVVIGTVMGLIAIMGAPVQLSAGGPHDKAVFGPALFVFIVFVFINVHHYFLDNVMWRRENPDIKQHQFTPHGPRAHLLPAPQPGTPLRRFME